MAINPRRKGAKAERMASQELTTWTGRKFARTPSSGGLHWKNTNSIGDVVCTEEGHRFPFAVEVKNYKEINFEHLLYLPEPKIIEFWEQCCRDAERGNKVPLLLMRYDNLPKPLFFAGLPKVVFKLLYPKFKQPFPYLHFHSIKWGMITLMPSIQLFKTDYEETKQIAKIWLNEKYGG